MDKVITKKIRKIRTLKEKKNNEEKMRIQILRENKVNENGKLKIKIVNK